VSLVVEALDRGVLDRSVHAFDLTVGPGMFGLGEAMIDIAAGAGHDESMRPEELLPLDLVLDVSRGPTVAGRIGEVSAIEPYKARP